MANIMLESVLIKSRARLRVNGKWDWPQGALMFVKEALSRLELGQELEQDTEQTGV